MRCPQCQTATRAQAKFCEQCGAQLPRSCAACGTALGPSARFCAECGAPVDEAARHVARSAQATRDEPVATHAAEDGERRQATVVFSDLAGYTRLNERLDPEEVEVLMRGIKTEASRIIEAHGGVVNQFVGDEVLALFGIPLAHEDDPVQAVRATEALHAMVRERVAEFEARVGQSLRLHSGINTGLIVTRSRDQRDGTYGITGDTVNVAARLVAQAGVDEIVVSPDTQRLIADYFTCEVLAPVVLRGKAEPVRPARIVGKTEVASRWEAAQRRGLTRYAGRDTELAALRDAMTRTQTGHGQFVTVMGEPGVGKSRLMFELRHALEQQPVTILEGRCQAHGTDTPYLPFVDALRRGLRLDQAPGPSALHYHAVSAIRTISGELYRYLPHLLHLLAIRSEDYPLPSSLQAASLRKALEEALAAAFTEAARQQPVLLILEDWHWADEASDNTLKYLVGLIPHQALVVVATYRPDYTRAWPAAEYYTPLVIKPLEAKHTEAMVRSVLRATVLPEGLGQWIHQRTAGNALFNEEVARALSEDESLLVREGAATLTRRLDDFHLPDTVQAIIGARVDRLDPEVREVLRLGSVIGREFGRAVLERLTGRSQGLAEHLDTLVRQDLVQAVRVVPEPTWIFKHVLVQEVVYGTLLLQRRRELHAQVADILETIHADRLDEHIESLARHYALSDRKDKAIEYLERAGDKTARYYSLREARSYYRDAVRLVDDSSAKANMMRTRATLIFKWADASAYSASRENIEALSRLLDDARRTRDDALETTTLYWLGRMHYGRSEMNQAATVLETCEARLAHATDAELLARTRIILSTVRLYRGEWQAAIEIIERAIAALSQATDADQWVYAQGLLGLYLGVQGRFGEASQRLDRALTYAREQQNKTRMAMTNVYFSVVHLYAGRLDSAIEYATQAFALSTHIGNPAGAVVASGVWGCARFLAGDQAEGIRLAESALQTAQAAGTSLATSLALGFLSEMHALAGPRIEAGRAIGDFQALKALGSRWGEIPVLRASAILAATTEAHDWERQFQDAIRLAEEQGLRPDVGVSHFRYAEALVDKGKLADAAAQLKRAEALFRELDMPWWLEQQSRLSARLCKLGA